MKTKCCGVQVAIITQQSLELYHVCERSGYKKEEQAKHALCSFLWLCQENNGLKSCQSYGNGLPAHPHASPGRETENLYGVALSHHNS